MQEDVLAPLATRHYKEIRIVGVSMGGFGAVLVGAALGGHVAGTLLLSPFLGDLGDRGLLGEIEKAGGLREWDAHPVVNEDEQRGGWRWLRDRVLHPEEPPLVYMGHGDKDVLNYGLGILADALPPGRAFLTKGTHDWPAWTTLWVRFLDETDFRSRCSP